MIPRPLVHLGLLLLLPGAPGEDAPGKDEVLPFEELARAVLEKTGRAEQGTGSDLGFDELVDGAGFTKIDLVALELRCPLDALDSTDRAEEVRGAVLTSLDVQRNWFAWLGRETEEKDWKAVRKWVESWSTKKLAKLEGGVSLFQALSASEKVLEAAERLAAATRPDEGTVEAVGARSRIVFAPTRRNYLELRAVAGWLHADQRETLWRSEAIQGTATWIGRTQLVAMRNVPIPVDFESPFLETSMNRRDETGLMQFMADRAAAALLRQHFWRHGTHFFELALATNLVIEAVGKNDLMSGNWELSYKSSGSSTRPYTRFVPGGNPAGGTLPARKAGPGVVSGSMTEVSAWRETMGEEFFLEPLREGQKAGGKLASKDKDNALRKDRTAHFELSSTETREPHAVSAPFLGPPAEGKTLPPLAYLDDYEDFFRAYRSGFVNWLREHGSGKPDASHEAFSKLLQRQAVREPGRPFHSVVEEVYGLPLSHTDGEVESLEWRYLAWLAKH